MPNDARADLFQNTLIGILQGQEIAAKTHGTINRILSSMNIIWKNQTTPTLYHGVCDYLTRQ